MGAEVGEVLYRGAQYQGVTIRIVMTLMSRQFGLASEDDVRYCASKENPQEGCSTSKRLSNAHFNLPRIMKWV
jgi:hypothetical protein